MLPDRSGCAQIVREMKSGGYFDRLMAAGPELDRVKTYIQAMAERQSWTPGLPLQYPDYPLFTGLRHIPFRQTADVLGAVMLQEQFKTIRDEWRAMDDLAYMGYAPLAMRNRWQVHLLHHMGVDLSGWSKQCPHTLEVISRLPGVCVAYPWGDALFSVHAGQSHLRPHCSVDNLRVRCHLALDVPSGCSIRVAQETRNWENGKVLLFEDSFEHEVWNHSDRRRGILILDFWHPDLTPPEIEALTAGFSKARVRRLFMEKRLNSIPSAPDGFRAFLEHQITVQDSDPLRQKYWDA